MDAVANLDPVSRTQFQPYIDLAKQACSRWGVTVTVDEGSVQNMALSVRTALQNAATIVSQSEAPLTYAGDTPGLVGSLPGLTLESLQNDILENANFGDEWGICFRITAGDVIFDVPLIFGIDEDSAKSVLTQIDGREYEFLCMDDIADLLNEDNFEIQAHADSWRHMKGLAKNNAVDLETAIAYRRPGAWDLFRGELTGMIPKSLPAWNEDDFQARYLLSVRYDLDTMAESRQMLALYASWNPEPFTSEWYAWFPQVTDLLHAIGTPRPITGMSVVMHFEVEEPSGYDWTSVNVRNVIVACGLDPVQAYSLLEYVQMDADPFYDLPETEEKRFTFMGATAVPDAMLASLRVTSSGRSEAYDRLAIGLNAKAREEMEVED